MSLPESTPPADTQRSMLVGIETGGTKLQLAAAAPDKPNVILNTFRATIDRQRGATGILNQIEKGMKTLTRERECVGIGFGFGGPVDAQRGRVIKSHQVDGWDDFDLSTWCQQRWRGSCVIGNDCNVAALAEAKLGAGQGVPRVLYVTVGTGVGGGLVINGRIDGVDRPAAAEVGHLRPSLGATSDRATVESVASGLGIEQTARQAMENPTDWDVSAATAEDLRRWQDDSNSITSIRVAAAAADGQPLAVKILDQATSTLGWALAQATTLTAPHRIVLGGGVTGIGESFINAVKTSWRSYCFPPLREECEIVTSALGEQVVLLGALLLAHDNYSP